ncbi:MAG: hypothetical protein HRT52_20130 [Colwellia sp.]|nr:hypothetical protein [Colwellia sp.]
MLKLNIIVILLLASFIARANEQKIYTIGVENIDYYPHYAFGHRENSFTKELLESFFSQESIEIKFVPLPLRRFNQWYIKDKIDFKYPDNKDWRAGESSQLDIYYSETVISSVGGSIVLNDNAKYDADNIQRLGTINGFYPTLWIKKIKSNKVQLIEDNNVISVIKLVTRGMVDAINLDYSVVNFHLNEMQNEKQLIMVESLPHRETKFHLSTIKHKALLKKFNVFLDNNQEYIQHLKDKFGFIDDPFKFSPKHTR